MEGTTRQGRRTLTPAVLASALFAAACAVFAVTFVAARGGLQMPVAPTTPAVAVASPEPSAAPSLPAPTASPGQVATPAPSAAASIVPTAAPTVAPTAAPSPTQADPLLALPACPDRPGCFEYLILRNDTLSHIADRYAVPISIVLALNPEITDPSVIVVGHVLYLGRDPRVRLERCPDDSEPGCWLYVVQPGDRLASIAARYGLTVQVILDTNPQITDQNSIYSGQVIRLIEILG